MKDNKDFNHGKEGGRYLRLPCAQVLQCGSICHCREGQLFPVTDAQNAGRLRGESWQLSLGREQFLQNVLRFVFLQKIKNKKSGVLTNWNLTYRNRGKSGLACQESFLVKDK